MNLTCVSLSILANWMTRSCQSHILSVRILSLSKRRTKVAFVYSDDKLSQAGISQDQSPTPSEVYGFVGSITTVVATVIFLIWAYLPESCLQYAGIHYYPSQYWVLAVPAFAVVIIISALVFYLGLNFIQTPHSTSVNTIFGETRKSKCKLHLVKCENCDDHDASPPFADEYSREPANYEASADGEEQPIEYMYDIGLHSINHIMFSDSEQHSK